MSLAAIAGDVRSETIFLKDGGQLKGRIIASDARSISIHTAGGDINLPVQEILKVDYSDAISPTTIYLQDGSKLVGRVEEQDESTLSLSTTLGILTILKSSVAEIQYSAPGGLPVQAPAAPPPSFVAQWRLRPGMYRLLGSEARLYGTGTGVALLMDGILQSRAVSLGLEPMFFRVRGRTAGNSLSVFTTSLRLGAHFFSTDGRFEFAPSLGIGGGIVRARYSAPENDLAARAYFLQKGDSIGLGLSYMIELPAYVFAKTGELSEDEWEMVRAHPEKSLELTQSAAFNMRIRSAVAAHHERWDGSGYPLGLAGEAIPVEARILAIADTFTALSTPRPYRPTFSRREALVFVRKHSGKLFDPQLVASFYSALLAKAATSPAS